MWIIQTQKLIFVPLCLRDAEAQTSQAKLLTCLLWGAAISGQWRICLSVTSPEQLILVEALRVRVSSVRWVQKSLFLSSGSCAVVRAGSESWCASKEAESLSLSSTTEVSKAARWSSERLLLLSYYCVEKLTFSHVHASTASIHIHARAPLRSLRPCVSACACQLGRKTLLAPTPPPLGRTGIKEEGFPRPPSLTATLLYFSCFSYITAEPELIWPGRRDRGQSGGCFRVLPRSTATDAFPKLRRQASHVAWTRLLPNKRGGKAVEPETAAAAQYYPSAALPRAASPFERIHP